MTNVEILFGICTLAFAVLAAWMWSSRSKVSAMYEGERRLGLERQGDLDRLRGHVAESRSEAERLKVEVSELKGRLGASEREHEARLEALRDERDRLERRIGELNDQFAQKFDAIASKTLERSNAAFLELATERLSGEREKGKADLGKERQSFEELVKPIGEVLKATREKLESIERSRTESFARLHEKIELISGASEGLRDETERLTRALSRPEVRGQYGEIQLKRVAELAGMTSYCDFTEQASIFDEDGALMRPDMVVSMPNGRMIAVDAKTNTYAYLEAVNAQCDEAREEALDRFARHMSDQAKKLSDKKYWSGFDGSPEFVVMFVPGDHFIDAALSRKPELIDHAAQHGVILASPSTLIGLLRAVAVGWREHKLTEDAQELFQLGRELHERAAVAFEHATRLGDSIRQSVERYNRMVGSMDTRLAPTLRRFEEAGAKSARALIEPKPVDPQPKLVDFAE